MPGPAWELRGAAGASVDLLSDGRASQHSGGTEGGPWRGVEKVLAERASVCVK